MALLRAEAEKLSNNTLVAGIVEELIERDDLFAVLPFMKVNSKAYVYERENEANYSAAGSLFVDVNETITEKAASFIEVVTKLKVLASDVDIDNFLRETMGDTNDQVATQLQFKAKDLKRQFQHAFVNGDATANPKEFDGISKLATAGQTIEMGTDGSALTLSALDQLLDQVPSGADAIVMRKGTVRAFRNLLRAAGGTTANEYMMEAFGRPMLSHNGVPIIVSDFITGAETQGANATTTSVYAVRLNEADGLHGLFGGDAAGIRMENVGTVQNKDSVRMRVKWYAGLALKSTKSIARLKGVTNV